MIVVPARAIFDYDAPFDRDFEEHSKAKLKEFQIVLWRSWNLRWKELFLFDRFVRNSYL